MEESIKALLSYNQLNERTEACLGDGEHSPTSSNVQIGGEEQSQAGPSHRPDTPPFQYNLKKI